MFYGKEGESGGSWAGSLAGVSSSWVALVICGSGHMLGFCNFPVLSPNKSTLQSLSALVKPLTWL